MYTFSLANSTMKTWCFSLWCQTGTDDITVTFTVCQIIQANINKPYSENNLQWSANDICALTACKNCCLRHNWANSTWQEHWTKKISAESCDFQETMLPTLNTVNWVLFLRDFHFCRDMFSQMYERMNSRNQQEVKRQRIQSTWWSNV